MPYEIPKMANTPYRPSNGTEGQMFQEEFCERCQHLTETGGCEAGDILDRSMLHKIGEPGYPEEWTHDFAGRPICTAFIEQPES